MNSTQSNVAEFPKTAASADIPVVEGAVCAPETQALTIPEKLFDDVLALTATAVGWSDAFRVVSVGYDIGTHVFEAFETYPLKRMRGMPGTGKTRSLSVDAALVYEPMSFTAETDAVMFRLAAKGGTLLIDEVTSLSNEAKKVLRAGWQRNARVMRCHTVSRIFKAKKGDKCTETTVSDYEVKGHGVYCPKVLAGQSDFNDTALEQRTLTFNMSNAPARADGKKWRGPLPDDFYSKAAALKMEIRKWVASVKGAIGKDAFESGSPAGPVPEWMDGRQAQTFNALYCLVPAKHRPMLDAFAKEHCAYIERETAETPEAYVVAALLATVKIPNGEDSITFYAQAVADKANETRSEDDEVTGKYVAIRLKHLGFENQQDEAGKTVRTKSGNPFVATRALLDRLNGVHRG